MIVSAIVLAATLAAADGDRDAAIRLARETLSREVSPATAAAAAVTDVTMETWPDSSLGCPVAGSVYTPSVVSGYRVLLTVGPTMYAVHVGNGRAVVCASAGASRAGSSPEGEKGRSAEDALRGLKLAETARRQLASRLRIPEDQIRIESYRATTWPDARLGCVAPDPPPPSQPTKGFLIQLRTADGAFEFHSDLSRVVECAADASAAPGDPKVR